MQWFRLYDDVLDDPKVQQLSPKMFRYWIKILCIANKGSERGRIPKDMNALAFRLRVPISEAKMIVHQLGVLGLLKEDGCCFVPHNWDERQKKSDSSAERVAAYRSRNVSEEQPRNVTTPLHVTPPEQSRTEQIQSRTELLVRPTAEPGRYTKGFEVVWTEYPHGTNSSKRKAYEAWKKLTNEEQQAASDALPAFKASKRWREGYIPHASTYLNQRLWETPPEPDVSMNGQAPHEQTPEEIAEFKARMRELQPQ